ncbi:MAG: bifunctional hydroxymethylpyrimidine kinase/phosphomethylpyrimidine kinase [Proteobacteria bacterium]|nr:bifunctional hydroxymethylpyrimidine kinase/phosphomethylpyrimidine kinase [Cystobacterineae bacterium]MCL2313849.1 bifunctional hydroxymethylpyrimidine kinase/phosphomethylpyrimidine kinase [Pseudomonadota bacterium]
MLARYATVLSIAASDSGGCAGLQADTKTAQALGCFSCVAQTGLTAQNTQGVQGIMPVPPEFVLQQINSVLLDFEVDATKVGLVPNAAVCGVVAEACRAFGLENLVVDPVLVASSKDALAKEDVPSALKRCLFPLATLITPNLDEAAALLGGRNISSAQQMKQAAVDLLEFGSQAVLLKGGHLPLHTTQGKKVVDFLTQRDGSFLQLEHAYIETQNEHGTGCTLSSAIAAHLAHGKPLHLAVSEASNYVHQALVAGKTVKTGKGKGPLNHAFAPVVLKPRPVSR